MTEHTLVLNDLSVTCGRTCILNDISASLPRGQIVGITGPNGAGKSTLISAISGQTRFDGTVHWKGQTVQPHTVAYMPQHSAVRSELTVLEAVLLGRHERLGWKVKDADVDAAAGALTSLNISHLAKRRLHTLSGGQQQLTMIAQRLVRKPDLLLLDESTSALDIHHQMSVMEHLRAYVQETGALVLIAMHDLNLATRHTDSLIMLSQGRLISHGDHETVLTINTIREAYNIEAEVLSSSQGTPIIVPLTTAAPV